MSFSSIHLVTKSDWMISIPIPIDTMRGAHPRVLVAASTELVTYLRVDRDDVLYLRPCTLTGIRDRKGSDSCRLFSLSSHHPTSNALHCVFNIKSSVFRVFWWQVVAWMRRVRSGRSYPRSSSTPPGNSQWSERDHPSLRPTYTIKAVRSCS